jgi:hypothetical protein
MRGLYREKPGKEYEEHEEHEEHREFERIHCFRAELRDSRKTEIER